MSPRPLVPRRLARADVTRLPQQAMALHQAGRLTAHLAGSIGKRAAVLIPHGGKARICCQHEGVWYPALRLFCQVSLRDWRAAVNARAEWARS